MEAIEARQPGMVELLLRRGADPNFCAENETPLMVAADLGYVDIGRILIAHGAPVDGFTSSGTALDCTVIDQQLPVIQLLLNCGANPGLKASKDVDSAIGLAYFVNRPDIVRLLRKQITRQAAVKEAANTAS